MKHDSLIVFFFSFFFFCLLPSSAFSSRKNSLNAHVMGLPLAAAVKALAAKVSILEPAKLDMVEARAQALLSKVHVRLGLRRS